MATLKEAFSAAGINTNNNINKDGCMNYQTKMIWNPSVKDLNIAKNESGLTWSEFWKYNCAVSEWSADMCKFVEIDEQPKEKGMVTHTDEKLAEFVALYEENEYLLKETNTRYYIGTNWVNKEALDNYMKLTSKEIKDHEFGLYCTLPQTKESKMETKIWKHNSVNVVTGVNGYALGTGYRTDWYGWCNNISCAGRDKNALIAKLKDEKRKNMDKMDAHIRTLIDMYKWGTDRFGAKMAYKKYGYNPDTCGVNMFDARFSKPVYYMGAEADLYGRFYAKWTDVLDKAYKERNRNGELKAEINEAYHLSSEKAYVLVDFVTIEGTDETVKVCPHCGSSNLTMDQAWRSPSVTKDDVLRELQDQDVDLGDRIIKMNSNGDIVGGEGTNMPEYSAEDFDMSLLKETANTALITDDDYNTDYDPSDDIPIDVEEYNRRLRVHYADEDWEEYRRGMSRDDVGIVFGYHNKYNGNITMGGNMKDQYEYERSILGGFAPSECESIDADGEVSKVSTSTFFHNVYKAFDIKQVDLKYNARKIWFNRKETVFMNDDYMRRARGEEGYTHVVAGDSTKTRGYVVNDYDVPVIDRLDAYRAHEESLLIGNQDEHQYEPQVPVRGRTKAEQDRIDDKQKRANK